MKNSKKTSCANKNLSASVLHQNQLAPVRNALDRRLTASSSRTIVSYLAAVVTLALSQLSLSTSAFAGGCVGDLCVGRGYAALNDSTDATVVNADSDGDGPGLWAVVVGTKYDGYGSNLTGFDPGTAAQLRVETNAVVMNKNTTVAGTNTLTVGGATTLSSTLGVTGATTLSSTLGVTGAANLNSTLGVTGAANLNSTLGVTGAAILNSTLGVTGAANLNSTLGVTGAAIFNSTLDAKGAISNSTGVVTFNDAIKTTNSDGANLVVNEVSGNASLTSTGNGHGLTITGTTSTVLKGGTNSGILTLQDGDVLASGATPAGTSITISGSGAGTAATVFQTTTDPGTTSVTTAIGTNAVYPAGSIATLQAGPTNAVTVNSGNVGDTPGVFINGVVGIDSTSTTGVLITGSGQNTQLYTAEDRGAGATPTWSDVAIQSANYGGADSTIGSAILITDYGVQIISPQPTSGQVISNNIGQNNGTGVVSNNFGGGTGITNNVIGNNNPQSTTQLNGGSTRMSLDDNGVNFSNASTGGPVSLSGVADGKSDFDAANIRQVFSAVAASMATAPTVNLAPGESGLGVGTGYYGGYSALGISFSHHSYSGTQLSFAVSRAVQGGGETAVRAGVGWKW